ncbi:Sec-independent protein translocase subunit TatA/TatB [Kaistella jeonii]|uniref:Sec-independent protein translocase protein TatA n=1 Tax=Kaistella jeonii TaxID=266749 RepID=A0A0C1FKB8_9FLAO|nr:twin-arginine translocase TatA/TatE family subunit [Kaistella jeonii]KIA88379.1 preprotein translocase [Kaistella jeonii]SFC22690.1 sec-independent protein translocase protein TatB [Kaistella jeonii]VEI94520.1 Sec-independent protein translocase protein TatA [Kaistella jeonii]
MELSIGEMMLIAVAIVVLFGPDKLPKIARDLGQGVRKMRSAMEDVKSEILKETDNPVSEIKKEIEKVKQAAQDYNPMSNLEKEALAEREIPKVNLAENDQHEGPVSR